MANGFPVAMVAGNDEMMGLMEDGTVMHGGTVNTNVMCMAAADVCLRKLAEEDGAVYRQLRSTGHALMDGLRERASKHEISLDVDGPGPYVDVTFLDEPELPGYDGLKVDERHAIYDRFCLGMLERGVRLMKGGTEGGSWFLSTAHTDEVIEKTLEAVDDTFASMT